MPVDTRRRRLVQQLARGVDATGRVGSDEAKAEVAACIQHVEQQDEGQQALDLLRRDFAARRVVARLAFVRPIEIEVPQLGFRNAIGCCSRGNGAALSAPVVAPCPDAPAVSTTSRTRSPTGTAPNMPKRF